MREGKVEDDDSWARITRQYKGMDLIGKEMQQLDAALTKATKVLRSIAQELFLERRTQYWLAQAKSRKQEWHNRRAINRQKPITRFPGFTSSKTHLPFSSSGARSEDSQDTETATPMRNVNMDVQASLAGRTPLRTTEAKITTFYQLQRNQTVEAVTSIMSNSF